MTRHLTYSNVVSSLCLFLLLGGGAAWAVDGPLAGQDTVGSEDIINREIRTDDIRDNNVVTRNLAPNAVTSPKIAGVAGAAFTDAGLVVPHPFVGNCFESVNRWEDLSANVNNQVGYYRDPLGFVHLQGVAVKCGSPPSGDTIFTLPPGHRPAKLEHHAAVYSSGAKEVQIHSTGGVTAASGPSPSDWVSLDGLTFRCAPSGSNGCP
jgi:hypothetical protein